MKKPAILAGFLKNQAGGQDCRQKSGEKACRRVDRSGLMPRNDGVTSVSTTFRSLLVLIIVSTLACALNVGRIDEANRWPGTKLSSLKRLDACLVASEIGCKLASGVAPAKSKVASALFDPVLPLSVPGAAWSAVAASRSQSSPAVPLHLAGSMVLRV